MQIDLILDARAAPEELAELGVLAEQKGFSGIWVSSLLDGRDPFAAMMPLAAATDRIAMGPIAVNPWDIHPVRISASLHTLNEAAGGRARIVIGGGGEALASLGLQPERRVRAVQECVEILRLASRGNRLDYAGQLYRVQGYQLQWAASAPPAVYVGANMPQMLRMAGRVADGIMLSDAPATLAAGALATAREARATNGADPDDLWSGCFTAWHVYDDEERGRREAARWLLLRGIFRPWVLETFLDADEVAIVMGSQAAFADAFVRGTHEIDGVPATLVDKLIDHLTLTATRDNVDGVVARLQEYRDLGLASISLRLYEEPAESIALLAERVLPSLA